MGNLGETYRFLLTSYLHLNRYKFQNTSSTSRFYDNFVGQFEVQHVHAYQLQNYAILDMNSGYLGYRLTIYIFKHNLIVLATKIGEN